jgi:hypothetical protein
MVCKLVVVLLHIQPEEEELLITGLLRIGPVAMKARYRGPDGIERVVLYYRRPVCPEIVRKLQREVKGLALIDCISADGSGLQC